MRTINSPSTAHRLGGVLSSPPATMYEREPEEPATADVVQVPALDSREVVKAVREGLTPLGVCLYARADDQGIVTLVDGPGPSRRWLGTTTLRRLREFIADSAQYDG
jgi:hypothetical protein